MEFTVYGKIVAFSTEEIDALHKNGLDLTDAYLRVILKGNGVRDFSNIPDEDIHDLCMNNITEYVKATKRIIQEALRKAEENAAEDPLYITKDTLNQLSEYIKKLIEQMISNMSDDTVKQLIHAECDNLELE